MAGVVHQRVAVQILGKQALAKRNAVFLAHLVKAVRLPNDFGCFNNEGGGVGVKLVGVHGKPAMLGLLKRKGKGVKGFLCAQPDKAALPQFHIGLEGVGIAGAHPTVQAVAGNQQVCVVLFGQCLVVLHIGLKHQVYTQGDTAFLQDVQQLFAPNAAKTMAA